MGLAPFLAEDSVSLKQRHAVYRYHHLVNGVLFFTFSLPYVQAQLKRLRDSIG